MPVLLICSIYFNNSHVGWLKESSYIILKGCRLFQNGARGFHHLFTIYQNTNVSCRMQYYFLLYIVNISER